MPDELETVLRLVADGRLTPEEAAPIIEALTRAQGADRRRDPFDAGFDELGSAMDEAFADLGDIGDLDERIVRRVRRRVEKANRRLEEARERAAAARERAMRGSGRGARHLRIRVTERGRQVVNLRIPIGLVDTALRFVPGIAGDQAERIRDSVRAGVIGPILDVEDPDGEGGVLISVE